MCAAALAFAFAQHSLLYATLPTLQETQAMPDEFFYFA
jgi:hypothetical protein